MEQVVLGIFQEQLAKVIVGFRKEQVNANLLNGKGEIRDVSLNCSFLNQAIAQVTPYIEFEEIHLSRLGFHVTSWTNLRKAPIIVDIGHVTAKVQEPLHCLPRNQRRRLEMITEAELIGRIADGFKPFRGSGSYGLVDRIVDNMTIEVESFVLEYQTWGKFKTQRLGPWTPPALQVRWTNLKVVMVDSEGNEASPDQVWEHNRDKRDTFMIYKKVSGECQVRLRPNNLRHQPEYQDCGDTPSESEPPTSDENDSKDHDNPCSPLELAEMKMEVQMAIQRRLRDGAVLAVQVDVNVPSVDAHVDSRGIHELAHLAAGLQYCIAKDRSFDDPLISKSESDHAAKKPGKVGGPTIRMMSRRETYDEGDDDEENDDDKEESNIDGGDQTRTTADDAASTDDISADVDGGSVASWQSDEDYASISNRDSFMNGKTQSAVSLASSVRGGSQRPVIILPNGLIVYKSISITSAVHDFSFRGFYPDDGYIEFNAKGCVTEVIWPKVDFEPGLYAQVSASFVSLQERFGQRKRTVLLGGMQRDDHLSLLLPSRRPQEIGADEFFPLFERRGIRDDPLDLRHLFPTQSFGLKTTIDILKRGQADDIPQEDLETVYMVLHEMGVDEMDIVLDTDIFHRMARFFLNEDGQGFDPRWHSGDWSDVLTTDMLHHPSEALLLDDYLQEPKQFFLDENSMPSSDLFNVTARLTNVEMRVPASIHDNLRSCDIALKWQETTFVISSKLPRTFLSGKIANSISGDARKDKDKGVIDFPNDPSDICYSLEKVEDPAMLPVTSTEKTVSTFRVQVTVRGFAVNIVPIISFCKASEPQPLVAMSHCNMIFCFEGEPAKEQENQVKITLFISILVHQLIVNVDLDLMTGATLTLVYHADNILRIAKAAGALFPSSERCTSSSPSREFVEWKGASRIKQSLQGRRILVQRHLSQSRESGGLAIVFCLQQNSFVLRGWRQNVPVSSPLRNPTSTYESSNDCDDGQYIDLLNLVNYDMNGFEIGVEFDFHINAGRRTVVKCYLQSASLQVCDLEEVIENFTAQKVKFAGTGSTTNWTWVDLCSFGEENLPGNLELSGIDKQFAFRLEGQHTKDSQSWSMAADVSSPSQINLHAAAIKNTALLVIEALLLPTWSKRADQAVPESPYPFPPGTIGALFHSLFAQLKGYHAVDSFEMLSLNIEKSSSDPIVERALRALCKVFLPSNLRVILLRGEIANIIVSIPSDKCDEDVESKNLSFLLNQSDIIVRFYPIPGSPPADIERVLACKGTDWSTLINNQGEGFFQRVAAKMCLLSHYQEDDEMIIETIVHPFEVLLGYSSAEVTLSMSQGLKIDDIRLIESFQSRLKSATEVSMNCFSELSLVVSGIRDRAAVQVPLTKSTGAVADDEKLEKASSRDYHFSVFRKTSNMLHKAIEELRLYENEVRSTILTRDDEIESLKIQLFLKERERFGALSIMASRVAGWIRMGSQHRIGQRVAKKSLVWPYWAVLRKDLLLLYPRPGVTRPADIICLVNARIKLLAGGRSRQDINRGFAIVESSGMTRYFVARNSHEFALWTKEIASSIRAYSDAKVVEDIDKEIMLSVSSTKAEFEEDDGTDPSAQRKRGIGNRLASVYQSAKQKSRALSEKRGRASSSDSIDFLEDEDDAQSGSLAEKQDAKGNYNRSHDNNPISDVSLSKRVQLGKKFSGVGQATKIKLGSAIQSARQKGVEISNRRRRVDSESDGSFRGDSLHDGSSDVPMDLIAENRATNPNGEISDLAAPDPRRARQLGNKIGSVFQNARNKVKESSEKQGRLVSVRGKFGSLAPDRNICSAEGDPRQDVPVIDVVSSNNNDVTSFWTCEACTFINYCTESESMTCEMCGKERKSSFTRAMSNETRVAAPSSPSAAKKDGISSCQSQNSLGETSLGPVPTETFNRSSSFDQGNIRRNARFPFRKRHEEVTDDSVFGGGPLTLKNIYVSDQIPPSIGSMDVNDIPLKRFEADWNVVVSQLSAANDAGGGLLINENNITNKVDAAKREIVDSSDNFVSGEEQSHLGYQGVLGLPEEPGFEGQRNVMMTQDMSAFNIEVFRTQTMLRNPEFVKALRFGDILKLHSEISEAIDPVLPYLAAKGKYDGSEDKSLGTGRLSKTDLIEKVLIFGRILGGLLQDFGGNFDHVHKYQCESIEGFLNALLACPLPIEALSSLSEIIGISDSTRDVDTFPVDRNEEKGCKISGKEQNNVDSLSRDRIASAMRLLSACEAEYRRAENMEAIVTRPTQKEPESLDVTPPPSHITKPLFYEPLLPPSFTNRLHDSIHEALMDTMAERDEAHAQLIGSNVMHLHSLEKERKKNDKLELDLKMRQEIARIRLRQDLQQPNIAHFFGKPDDRVEKMRKEIDLKIEAFHQMHRNNSGVDEEMAQLSNQLSNEIAAKTSSALEIERLKNIREAERKTEHAEKEAIKDELKRVKELLAAEEKKCAEALKEAGKWKALYEFQTQNGNS